MKNRNEATHSAKRHATYDSGSLFISNVADRSQAYYGGPALGSSWDEGRIEFNSDAGERDHGFEGWRERALEAARKGPHWGKGPKGYRRDDERVREDVCECLWQAADVDASDMEVSVREGEVTLSGMVEDRFMKRAAELAVEQVKGVKEVHNVLRIRSRTQSENRF